jgi:mRNA-degrading endonuclease RelE of RelBE toxin-antitoxin system
VSWTVRFSTEAKRQADALFPPVRLRISLRLCHLATDPRSAANVKAMSGSDQYRLPVDVLMVLVLRIGHRREVYR